MLQRRRFLHLAGTGASAAMMAPGLAFAKRQADTGQRFVFVIQRGAADGLNIVIPHADPAYGQMRGTLAIDQAAAIKLDGMFSLHPALTRTAAMFAQKEAAFVHAVASPYRERSHFDAQNVLETGGAKPHEIETGWLNRLAGMLPARDPQGVALAPIVPLALRGKAPVTSFAPTSLPAIPADLLDRVGRLYERDRELRAAWVSAVETHQQVHAAAGGVSPARLGLMAAQFLRQPGGPQIAMLESAGWDTHGGQTSRLTAVLGSLDAMLGGLREGLGSAWANTTVLVATEFGRTVRANGTGGTDHGTGAVAWILGGGVNGGRVIADWPGLRDADLLDGRDLRPTMALDGLIASVASQAFGLDPGEVAHVLFGTRPSGEVLPGLVKPARV